MSLRGLLLVGLSALLTAAANLFLRAGVTRAGGFSFSPGKTMTQALRLLREPTFDVGVMLYGLAALVWFSVLSIEDLSTSYPILVGCTFVLVAIGASAFFSESMPWVKLLGMAVILAGIVLIAGG